MGKTLYLECYSGISGDMTVAALLDLGADCAVLDRVLKSLKVSGFETKISRVVKSGIDACDFDVVLDKEHENHDHDMKYLHGHHHEGQERNHVHGTGTAQDHHHHEHRGIKEIAYIIDHSAMTENAKKLALRIFEILAEAESKAHNVPVDQVHFHEVGAVDSIVDIVSVAVCLDDLDVTEVIVPVLWEGHGMIRCQHGLLPIPVPAVANIVSANHLHLKMTEVEGELVTPTGAAIVAAVKTKDKLPETFEIQKIGIGAGKRQYECPGILRVMIISESTEQAKGRDKAKAQTEEFKNPEIRNNPKAENQETKDTIDLIARGRVWTGRQAQKLGLIDDLGGFSEAVVKALKAGKVKENQKIKIVSYPKEKSFGEKISALLSSTNNIKVEKAIEQSGVDITNLKLFKRLQYDTVLLPFKIEM